MSRPRPVMTSWWPHDDLMMTSWWPLASGVIRLLWSETELPPPTGPGHLVSLYNSNDIRSSVCRNKPFFSKAAVRGRSHWMGLIASLSIFWTIASSQPSQSHFPQLSPTLTVTAAICIEHKRPAPVWVWIVIPPNARWPYTSGDGLSPPPSPDSEPALTLHTAAQAAGSGAFLSSLIENFYSKECLLCDAELSTEERRRIHSCDYFTICAQNWPLQTSNLGSPAACECVVSSVGLETAVYPMCIKMPVDMHPESAAHRLEFRI